MTTTRPPISRRTAHALVCAIAFAPALAPTLRAQEPQPRPVLTTAGDSALLASLAALTPRARLLADTGGRLLAGRYLGHDGDTLWIKTGSVGGGAIPVGRIRALHVQRGSHAATLGFIGAVIVGSIGWFFGSFGCEEWTLLASVDCGVPFAIGGAVIGTIAGGVLGSLMPRYARQYPPPRTRPNR